ncbi:CBS domain-containing protein [Paenibacillus filicis]|uniref:CBS domain-containing protein n=1 Tax=Paenibacillus filicis TaxID=669464 RepID=A0ABU9DIX7_9BACL
MIKLHQYKYKEEYTYYMLQALKEGRGEAFRKDFLDLHPSDQTEFFLSLDDNRRMRLYTCLTPVEFGEIFSELRAEMQKRIITELAREYAVEMLNELPSDDAADFIGLLTHYEADFFLTRMEQEEAEDIKQLLVYEEGTAGSLMTADVFTVAGTDTAAEVLNRLRYKKTDAETIYYLYVTDHQERLFGVVSLRQLIIAPAECVISEIMNAKLITVPTEAQRVEVLEIIKKYGLLAVPVVTPDDVLLGIITFDDVVSFL